MTTHHVNQELAKHHYATLLREADDHRLVRREMTAKAFARQRQLTWLLRPFRRPAVA